MTLKEAVAVLRSRTTLTIRKGDEWCSIQPTGDDHVVWLTGTGKVGRAPTQISSLGFACCEVQTMLSGGWTAVI